ncbi:MAG: HD domain-containing protein [Wenyingzhuangia sp.]|jgi:uncharacterized protein|uniref:HD domain-containing protein n=1 Tax=Wenyingzhuangia sp. TaxID=1964193 RepID=UPI00321B5F5E
MDRIIRKTVAFVKEKLKFNEGGHDWFHTERVYNNALFIAHTESCDLLVVSLSALLHDIADAKFHGGDEQLGPKVARDFLISENVNKKIIDHVVNIIENISFKGGHEIQRFRSKELDIVQDADRLEAIGAIGIARTFNYGGFKNRPIYDPEILPNLKMSKEEYKHTKAPTINHFYEKLLLLKDRMNTTRGSEMADKRHRFMELFLSQFYDECNGVL